MKSEPSYHFHKAPKTLVAGACANCHSRNVKISNLSQMAPFFAWRVHGVESATLLDLLHNRAARIRLAPLNWLAGRFAEMLNLLLPGIFNTHLPLRARSRVCLDCSFVGPEHEYTEAELINLYRDYRSAKYIAERAQFEPGFELFGHLIGTTDAEINARLKNVESLIETHIPASKLAIIQDVLDWGGGQGLLVPRLFLDRKVIVFDVSEEALSNNNFRSLIDMTESGHAFDYIHICHVLEHVGSLSSEILDISKYLRRGGYLYIEVPQDLDDHSLTQIAQSDRSVWHVLHEHINLYSVSAVRALAKFAGLEEIVISRWELDLGWSKSAVISGLFRRP